MPSKIQVSLWLVAHSKVNSHDVRKEKANSSLFLVDAPYVNVQMRILNTKGVDTLFPSFLGRRYVQSLE